jgi:alkylation response protein AidB-like acyl-CoA dehydrogenase
MNATTPENDVSSIDTSKMSAGQRAAIELTEAARERTATSSFVADLFMGKSGMAKLFPFPEQTTEDRDQGDAFLERLGKILREQVDPDAIDRTGEIPDEVIAALAGIRAFAIKVPTQYGGLGLSQTNYCRAAMLLGSYCGNLTALISAHQSIGVPQPLILFGTEEQKRKHLPRFAHGEISAFALTENGVGSDPARMLTRAEPTPDGEAFILNGEKLWCTNGTRAGVIIVMAKTPPKIVNGASKDQITAFIVEMHSPGMEVVRRCHFMGLRALYNGVIRFNNVCVPRENILLGEGKGLRVALTTLNTGRLTLPAACVGMSKRCLDISRRWAAQREQWGAPIGRHAFIADKLARMAADTFAMESMTLYAASLVDKDKHADVRLEAALCKLWGTEVAWRIANDTMQIRGGRGYETADSLRARGEEAEPVERMLRDCRINTIFEGSSEIMRLFIAREALDPHLKVAGAMFNSKLPMGVRMGAAMNATAFYARWYPMLFVPQLSKAQSPKAKVDRRLRGHLRFMERNSRKLARSLFHAMARFGPKLERQQLTLGRFVDIAAELFAIAATCARASALQDDETISIADYFCRMAELRVANMFRESRLNEDRRGYKLAQVMLKDTPASLASGFRQRGAVATAPAAGATA